MEITINGKKADITIEDEKTVGEVLAALEQWLEGTGNRLSGLSLDGEAVPSGRFGEAFARELAGLKSLGVTVLSWCELAGEAYGALEEAAVRAGDAAFEERGRAAADWEQSPQAAFLKEEAPDIHALALRAFRGEGAALPELAAACRERQGELADPRGALSGMAPLVTTVVSRLQELPLDMQTGKDARAAETMRLFAGAGEKLFRLFPLLRREGALPENLVIDGEDEVAFISEFNAALSELSAAYRSSDTVLTGDLAEYELAPRLSKFFAALTP